jgi:hypothetical protein
MQVKTQIDLKNNLRIHTVSGLFDLDELLTQIEEIYNDSKQNLEMEVLWDLRQAESLGALETHQLDKLINLVSQRWEASKPRRAALVVSRLVDFGLARMYEMRMESKSKNEIRVFNDIEEAFHWLGLNSI